MKNLTTLVTQAQTGDLHAFSDLVHRFQDMAVGYAYSMTGDFFTAEDATQEAFMNAYSALGTLRTPEAFPSWLRRIVFKYCDRRRRKRDVTTVPLDIMVEASAPAHDPEEAIIARESMDDLYRSLAKLPEQEREVIVLFYMCEHTHQAIAEFLQIPAKRVDQRLRSGRRRLKREMVNMVQNILHGHRPSKDDKFSRKMLDGLTRVANQERFLERLSDACLRGTRRFGVIKYNIDYFREFNDTHGHIAGDCVLSVLAKRAQSIIGEGDIVARYGDEEFTLILHGSTKCEVTEKAEKLRTSISDNPYSLDEMLRPEARLTSYDYSLSPNPANEPFSPGVSRLIDGELEGAESAFRVALESDPDHVPSIMEIEYLKKRRDLAVRKDPSEPLSFTISGGLAYRRDSDTPESLLRRVDARLALAKENGRDQIRGEG